MTGADCEVATGEEAVFEGGTSGIFRLVVKFNIAEYSWSFFTLFDFTIIFHLRNY